MQRCPPLKLCPAPGQLLLCSSSARLGGRHQALCFPLPQCCRLGCLFCSGALRGSLLLRRLRLLQQLLGALCSL